MRASRLSTAIATAGVCGSASLTAAAAVSCIAHPGGAAPASLPSAADDVLPPLVPALRYGSIVEAHSPSEDAPFRVSGPVVSPGPPPSPLPIQSIVMDNGLRVVVVHRQGLPIVAARLVIDLGSIAADDVGGRRAYLLGGTFLSAPERVAWRSGGCGVDGCSVSSRGLSNELGEVLGRIADLVVEPKSPHSDYARRFAASQRAFEQSESPIARNARALIFGASCRYGGPPPEGSPAFADLETMRDRAFVPSAATLVVVGDVAEERVRIEASEKFGKWVGPEAPPRPSVALAPLPAGPRIVLVVNRAIGQVWGVVAARGPAVDDRDFAAFVVLTHLLGGRQDSTLFHHVREDLGAAYSVAGSLDWYKGLSVMSLTASFDRQDAITGVRALLDAIGTVQVADPPPDVVERARASAVAGARLQATTDEGIAATLAGAVPLGLRGDFFLREWPELLASVSAAQVGAVARRYLRPEGLRVVLMGKQEYVRGAQSLGLGDPVWTDAFGRPLPASSPTGTKRPGG